MGAAVGRAGLPARPIDAVTLFAGEGPRGVVDQLSRDAGVAGRDRFAACLRTVAAPEAADGLRRRARRVARARAGVPRGGLDEGAAANAAGRAPASCRATRSCGAPAASPRACPRRFAGATLPKFRAGGLLIVHAGGGAGLFSTIIGGWVNGADRQPARHEGGTG